MTRCGIDPSRPSAALELREDRESCFPTFLPDDGNDADRDWARFHSPKNLSMALSVEVAELLEHFQWLTESESASLDASEREQVAAEIADVQIYLAMLADKLDVDIESAVAAKLEANAAKYPPGKDSSGTSGGAGR